MSEEVAATEVPRPALAETDTPAVDKVPQTWPAAAPESNTPKTPFNFENFASQELTLFEKEPALVIGSIISVIVAIASIFHVAIDANAVTGVLVSIAPIVTSILVRAHVTPAIK